MSIEFNIAFLERLKFFSSIFWDTLFIISSWIVNTNTRHVWLLSIIVKSVHYKIICHLMSKCKIVFVCILVKLFSSPKEPHSYIIINLKVFWEVFHGSMTIIHVLFWKILLFTQSFHYVFFKNFFWGFYFCSLFYFCFFSFSSFADFCLFSEEL